MLSLGQAQKDGETCPRSPGAPSVPRTKTQNVVSLRPTAVVVSAPLVVSEQPRQTACEQQIFVAYSGGGGCWASESTGRWGRVLGGPASSPRPGHSACHVGRVHPKGLPEGPASRCRHVLGLGCQHVNWGGPARSLCSSLDLGGLCKFTSTHENKNAGLERPGLQSSRKEGRRDAPAEGPSC